MAKAKTSSVKSVAVEQTVTETSAATPSAEAAVDRSVVVLAFPGSEQTLEKIWPKYCQEDLHIRTAVEGERVSETLAELIADITVASDFVLVPANFFPVRPVSWEELVIPTEDVSGAGVSVWGRTPVRFDKDALVDLLSEAQEDLPDEEFVKLYQKRTLSGIRYQVAHDFGNYYTKVLRADPCEHALMEGFVRKHFIYSSAKGWPAVNALALSTILSK
jgi:hypothetical protein